MIALPLPPAPRQSGIAPGWHRNAGGRPWLTVHRLRADENGRAGRLTLCGRSVTSPEQVHEAELPTAVCTTCETSARRFPVLPDEPAPPAGPARTVAVVVPDPLVAIMLDDPDMLDRLDELHHDDGSQHCHTCGGPQSGRHRYPCTIRNAVDRATRLRDQQTGGPTR